MLVIPVFNVVLNNFYNTDVVVERSGSLVFMSCFLFRFVFFDVPCRVVAFARPWALQYMWV